MKFIIFASIFLLSSCGTSIGSAPVQPSFSMETKIIRVSPEAKGMVISVSPQIDAQ